MIYGYAIAAVVALAAGFSGGWKVRDWQANKDTVAALEAESRARVQRESVADAAAVGFEKDRAAQQVRRRTITVEVEKIVDRPIYRDGICIDADGLRLVASAVGAAASAAGRPASAVPGSYSAR